MPSTGSWLSSEAIVARTDGTRSIGSPIGAPAHDERHTRPRHLFGRHVELGLRGLRQPGLEHVADDAHDAPGRFDAIADDDLAAEGVFARVVPARGGLREDRHEGRIGPVLAR